MSVPIAVAGTAPLDMAESAARGNEQKQRVMAMMTQSGLGSRAQQVGQQLISGYQNQRLFRCDALSTCPGERTA